jgi:NAD(P) transhydrogenase
MGYLFSSLCCVGGISGLSNQKTARVGNALGIVGVLGGVVTALASLNLPTPVFIQALALLGSAGALGTTLGYRVAVTELP